MSKKGSTPADRGTYVIVLQVSPSGAVRHVGSLGRIEFRPGYYCYVGSALNGLNNRVRRHFVRTGKNNHWHIDYLRSGASVICAAKWTSEKRWECQLSQKLSDEASYSIPDFGTSDCSCDSHLHYFQDDPTPLLKDISLDSMPPSITRKSRKS